MAELKCDNCGNFVEQIGVESNGQVAESFSLWRYTR